MTSFFMIVATVYVTLAGAPADTTGTKQWFRHNFETLEECKAYMNTDEFSMHRQELAGIFISKFKTTPVPKLTIVAACEEIKPKGGDEGKI